MKRNEQLREKLKDIAVVVYTDSEMFYTVDFFKSAGLMFLNYETNLLENNGKAYVRVYENNNNFGNFEDEGNKKIVSYVEFKKQYFNNNLDIPKHLENNQVPSEKYNCVRFKSTPDNFYKEIIGAKCNTFRKIDAMDNRFLALRKGCKYIIIQHADYTYCEFVRQISDYTEWDGYGIISWLPEEQSNR
jgi:hypothetical protein